MSGLFVVVALLLQAQDLANDPALPYEHVAAGLVCPASTEEVRRVSVSRFDPAGLDVSCGYNLAGGIIVTVYSYPGRAMPLADSFDAAKSEISRKYPSFEVESEDNFALGTLEARRGVFKVKFRGAAAPVRTELILALREDRLLKFRVTFMGECEPEGIARAESFLRGFPVPRKPE
jgi:hypothetical protein